MPSVFEALESLDDEFVEDIPVGDCSVIGNSAIESEITMMAIREECSSDEEFSALLEAAGSEAQLYEVIMNPEIATEAIKKTVIKDWKAANFNRIQKRTAIRLAMINNDTLYAKYRKYRDLLLETRGKIYVKYGNKAKVEAKKIIKNSRNKAANMTSQAGKDMAAKLDKAIDTAEKESK